MSGNLGLLILLASVGGFGYWCHELNQEIDQKNGVILQTKTENQRLQDQIDILQYKLTELNAEIVQKQKAIGDQQKESAKEFDELKAKYSLEFQRLQNLQARLNDLKKTGGVLNTADIDSHIRSDNELIQSFNGKIKALQTNQKLTDQEAGEALNEQRRLQKNQQQQLDDNLKTVNQAIAANQVQINQWNSMKKDVNRQDHLTQLTAEQNQLRAQIQDLRQQKVNLAEKSQTDNHAVQDQNNYYKGETKQNAAQIEAQLGEAKADLAHWQELKNSQQKTIGANREDLRKAQTEYELQSTKVHDMADALRIKTEELRKLSLDQR